MSVTAEQVFLQSNIDAEEFGTQIIPTTLSADEKRQAAILHIDTNILPGAKSDVEIPVRKAARGNTLPLPTSLIKRKYPDLDEDGADNLNTQMQFLYDEAVKSYARSEVNKQVATNRQSYDEDADQDRKIADDRVAKLLMLLEDIFLAQDDKSPNFGDSARLASTTLTNRYSF